MGKILNAFEGGIYHLTFKVGVPDNPDAKGQTKKLSGNNYEILINSTDSRDHDYSRIWLAKTFIHEDFHAKLKQRAYIQFDNVTISGWLKPIKDMDLKELAFYFENSSKALATWGWYKP